MKVASIWYSRAWQSPRWMIKLHSTLTYKKQKKKKAKVDKLTTQKWDKEKNTKMSSQIVMTNMKFNVESIPNIYIASSQ